MLIRCPGPSSLACSIIVKCRDKKGVFFYNLTGFVVLSSTGSLVYHTRRGPHISGLDNRFFRFEWATD